MQIENVYYQGKYYEISVDKSLLCCGDCSDCPYVQTVGDDDFIEFCGRTGEQL